MDLPLTSGRWRAIERRDTAADGAFVYAVTSTGIYCRPSCPSRRPGRLRVRIFATAPLAAAAGFRACRRCRPDGMPVDVIRVRRACAAMAAAPGERWSAARMAQAAAATPAQVQRAFRRVLGVSPGGYGQACRRRAFLGAVKGGLSVTEALFDAGYGSSSRVYGNAIRLPGMTPATYGKGGRGARIEWMTSHSPLGRILVAATHRGLCMVEVGSTDEGLESCLRREFPQATLVRRTSPAMRSLSAAACAVAAGRPVPADVPVDIAGTAFQWRVWTALTTIPRGGTWTYSELAQAIGVPSAVRAVARACGANPLALLVPCHRVLRRGGALGGYRWGLDVKRALLSAERA